MSNLTRKVISAVAAFAVLFTAIAPVAGVNAAYSSSLDAANKLAQVGVIVDQSANPADYRLGDNITRREMVKIAMQLAVSQGVAINTAYMGKFSDVPEADWAWKYAETALGNGFVSANPLFNPSRMVTKAESLKMIMNAAGIDKSSNGTAVWEDDYVEGGVLAGIVESFSDYAAEATRGWIFKVAASALDVATDDVSDDDLLDDLLDGLDDTDTDTGSTDDDVVVGGGTLMVSLSAETPDSNSVPGGISGLPVAAFDLTAGDEDVTVTSITLKRRGLSDKDTLTNLAAFSDEGRASKGKNDSEMNDTEATLTLTNGFVVKAGETETLSIVADIASSATGANDEFAIELVEVVASASAETDGSLVANTFRIGSVDAPSVAIERNGTVSNPKLGDEGVDIFKFQVKGASTEDIVLKSITFKADNSNAEDNLANFVLVNGTKEVATTAMMNGKYLTFDLGDGYTVAEDKLEKFVVKADIIAGAGDVIKFIIDKNLDVSAEGTKYGHGASINITDVDGSGVPASDDLGSITLQAGELTLVDIDATSDKMREDKDDVTLGKMTVTNVSGGNLELQQFGVKAVLSPGTATGSLGALTLAQTFENFELVNEDTGAAYELTENVQSPTVSDYRDADLNITLPQGTVTFLLRADTKKDITNFDDASVTLSLTTGAVATTGGFYVVETEDDQVVTDLTPSTLSWKKVSGSESSATVSLVPLSNITKVRGATGVVSLQFEVEADESSALTMDEAKVSVWSGATAATNQQISEVALYKGSVSDANLLDKVSGSNLASGVATLDGFSVEIAANAKQTFVATISIVDGANAIASYTTKLDSVSVEDEDSDDVLASGTPITSGRLVTVTDQGTVTLASDSNNTDNEYVKTILGGTSKVVYSADVQAANENVDVETVTFTLDKDVKDAVVSASLYLGDTLIATNSNSDITTASVITFKNLTNLEIPQESKELRLAINTATIGFEKVGETVKDITVTAVGMTDATGVDSGKDVTVSSLSTTSKLFSIVPAVVTPSVAAQFGTEGKLMLTVDGGSNSASGSNSSVVVDVQALVFSTVGSSYTGSYNLYVDGNSASVATASAVGTILTFNAAALDATFGSGSISSNRTYVIAPSVSEVDKTVSLKLTKDGVTYDVTNVDASTGLKVNLTNELDFGSHKY